MDPRFKGRTIIVTGAAGGIGRATCARIASEGGNIVAVDLDAGALQATMDAVTSTGGRGLAIAADVSQVEDVERYVTQAEAEFGGVDALFNNAGIEGAVSPIDEYPLEMFQKVLSVNLTGVFLGIKYVVPALRRRGGGVIVNTASIAGITGNPVLSAYNASKHGVIGLTRSAALSYAKESIRVNAVCPSPIETRMMRALESGLSGVSNDTVAAKAAIANRIPMGRYGEPEEVAALVAFLMSDDAKYITGSMYTVDGGMTPH